MRLLPLLALFAMLLSVPAWGQEKESQPAKPDFNQYSRDTLVVVADKMHDEIVRLRAEVEHLQTQVAELRKQAQPADRAQSTVSQKIDAPAAMPEEDAQRQQDEARWLAEWQQQADKLEAELEALRAKVPKTSDPAAQVQLRRDIADKQRELANWGKQKRSYVGSIAPAVGSRGRLGKYVVERIVDGQTMLITEVNLPVRLGNSVSYHGRRSWHIKGIDTTQVARGNGTAIPDVTLRVTDTLPGVAGSKIYVLEIDKQM